MRTVKRRVKSVDPEGKIEFEYIDSRGKVIDDPEVLQYIHSVRVPPAYKKVVINLKPDSKVFAKGEDDAGRRQYIYNPKYVEEQSKNKYCNLIKFGRELPRIREKIDEMIQKRQHSLDRMIALILRIIMQCNFRVGNEVYRKKHHSYGISTIEPEHVRLNGDRAKIKFIGKKGVLNECALRNSVLVDQLHELIDKGGHGQPLFWYKEGREKRRVTAIDINNFLRKFGPFTSKSFRTWEANMVMFKRLLNAKQETAVTKRKKQVRELIKDVAVELHHTPAICKRSYLVPSLLNLYVESPTKFGKLRKEYKGGKPLCELFIQYLESVC